MVFGYICAECNFVQIDKASVEIHVKMYHLGENIKIYKSNMLTIMLKPTEVQEEKPLAEVGEDVSKKQIQAEVEQKNEKEKLKNPEPRVQELQSEPVEEVVKEVLTVFKPNTEYDQENIELDEQKLEKMNEIYKTIIPKKKFSFNLRDKIKSRLDDRHVETIEKAYDHLPSMHKNYSEDEQMATIEASEVKYLRRLSNDKLLENQLDDSNDTDSVILVDDEPLYKIVNVEPQQEVVLEDIHFPFCISSVTTLTPEEEQALITHEITPPTTAVENMLPTLTVINGVAGAGGTTTLASPTTSPRTIPCMTATSPNKSTAEDVDPLRLEQAAYNTITEENRSSVSVEHTFTEAKLDCNFSCSHDGMVQEFSDLTAEEVSFTVENMTKKQCLMGRDLFKCDFCKADFESTLHFRAHVSKCVEVNKVVTRRPFKCCHCVMTFKSCNSLINHIRLHGTVRFACSLCDFKHQHQLHVRFHMKTRHNVTNVTIMPVDLKKCNYDEDEFVVHPNKFEKQKSTDGSYEIRSNSSSATDKANKHVRLSFGPDKIAALPLCPIFTQEIKCSACTYQTKVRTNLVRHFQFHLTGTEAIPTIDPVNPVPCLEKNEKMFDKMINLALSSFTETRVASRIGKKEKSGLSKEEKAQLPVFVPATKRYVCGISYCNYLCLEESMLRHHLQAVHIDESVYTCTHCSEKLLSEKGVINVNNIIKHLRLHDLHLYKCSDCKFLHNWKHRVERHVFDEHTDKPATVMIIRDIEHEPEEARQEQHKEVKETKPWRCGMCKYRCAAKKKIIAHVYNRHKRNSQHKCALCKFQSNKIAAFSDHFHTDHPGQNVDVVDAYYKVQATSASKNTPEGLIFDTTPLWQRDKNKCKHIRGILVDPFYNLNKTIEAVASGVTHIAGRNISALEPKKPKTLKEKRLAFTKTEGIRDVIEIDDVVVDVIEIGDDVVDVIEIDDDPIDVISVDSENKKIEDKENDSFQLNIDDLIIQKVEQAESIKPADANTPSMEEIKKMDVSTLRNTELSGTYGSYGKPSKNQFVCPLCRAFKTQKAEDFTCHLYKELHYFRFVCTSCGLTSITYNVLQKHSAKSHTNLPEAIHPLSPDAKIEDWVQKVLVVQRRLILHNESLVSSTSLTDEIKNKDPVDNNKSCNLQSGVREQLKAASLNSSSFNYDEISSTLDSSNSFDADSSTSKEKLHQCQHRSYNCKAGSNKHKHEKHHWVQKPLKCTYCNVDGFTNFEVIQHSKRAPGKEALAIAVLTSSTPTIKPVIKKRKYPSDEVQANEPALEISEYSVGIDDTFILICNYCPKRCDTKSELRLHWKAKHKERQLRFKYKKVIQSQCLKKASVRYKCCYCDSIGPREVLKRHFQIEHPGITFAVFRYKCPHCGDYFKIRDKLKAHCKLVHGNWDPVALDIKEPLDETANKPKNYVCKYCSREFDVPQEIVDHHKAVHTHLELNLPPNLTMQSAAQPSEQDEMKKFMCPRCSRKSNSYASIREHIRAHVKPFQCYYCPYRNSYPSFLKSHWKKEHPNMEFKCKSVQGGKEMNKNLRENILVLQEDGSYRKIRFKNAKRATSDQSAQPSKIRIVESFEFEEEPRAERLTARKSTTHDLQSCKSVIKQTARKSTTQFKLNAYV